MKKIIAGKLYNTATADEVASMYAGQCGDFNFYEASILRTKKGALFLYESGGARSKMSVYVGNNGTGGSSDIHTISETEAVETIQEWHIQNNIDAEDVAKAMKMLDVELEEA